MPPWHHQCGCPSHRRGQLCPVCDGPEYWPQTREEWEDPPQADVAPVAQQLDDLREAIERLTDRIDELEAEGV